MEFQLPFTIPQPAVNITHHDTIMLTGSCFTEHIGNKLAESKFPVLVNPHGILFNPASIASGLEAAISKKEYEDAEIFLLNGIWSSWDFHSAFSNINMTAGLQSMNDSMYQAHATLSTAKYLVVTFGSAYQYFLKAEYTERNKEHGVSNCHKAPGKWFDKRLLSIAEMFSKWVQVLHLLKAFNAEIQVIFTVSPVRHYRDGLVENNRSKARLLELVHLLTDDYAHCHYFPAYELVMDVLRDYRFFDQDMVHPNIQATQYVWEQFVNTYMNNETQLLLKRLKEVTTAVRHTERFPGTDASLKFRETMKVKTQALKQEFPSLNLEQELKYFS